MFALILLIVWYEDLTQLFEHPRQITTEHIPRLQTHFKINYCIRALMYLTGLKLRMGPSGSDLHLKKSHPFPTCKTSRHYCPDHYLVVTLINPLRMILNKL